MIPHKFFVKNAATTKRALLLLLLAGLITLSACCGNGNSQALPQTAALVSGNWQFNMTAPSDNSYVGGLQGGFLLQSKGSISGGAVYSVSLPQPGAPATLCSGGSASVTGTINGSTVNLTAASGTQSFTLTGTLSSDGSTMMGTYNSTDGKGCGTAQKALKWSATSVPTLTGDVQGLFHSTGSGATLSLKDQAFLVTGSLLQSPNTGSSNATVTGTLTFQGYPCMSTASVNGQVSGNSVVLQVITPDGLNVGQIGAQPGTTMPSPVTVSTTPASGALLLGANGYGVSTKGCKGAGTPGDVGDICLAFGTSTGCTQPITLTPAAITFPSQLVGSASTTQTLTLTNTDPSGATLTGLQLSFRIVPTADSSNSSDFNLLPSFSEQDSCATSTGSSFALKSQESCTITISFSPQQSCPWLPIVSLGGAAPSQCPPFLPARVSSPPAQTSIVSITTASSPDVDSAFAVPISGVGVSSIEPSTPELDFGAEAVSESSAPQTVSFVNQGNSPVLILPAMTASTCGSPGHLEFLTRPLSPGTVPGLQVVTNAISIVGSTIGYVCDQDTTSGSPSFQITADNCSGTLLAPHQSCIVMVVLAPQPATSLATGLDYFLELNTLQCTSTTTSNCEIDSGRFPVELKANLASPLRMTPGAGLDFAAQTVQTTSAPLIVTLFNDPNDANAGTVNFTGNVMIGDYTEVDDCGTSLAAGASCAFNVTFTPTVMGFDQGTLTITYNGGQTQVVHFRGTGQ